MAPEMTKSQKIAVMLMSLGAERAARVLEQLPPEQAAQIIQETSALGQVSHQAQRTVLREFRALVGEQEQRKGAPSPYEALSARQSSSAPPYLATVSPARAAELLGDEPAPVVARMLSALTSAQAAAILVCFPPELSARVREYLTALPAASLEVRARLEKAVRRKSVDQARRAQQDGTAMLRETLDMPLNMPPVAPEPSVPPAPVRPSWQMTDLLALDNAVLRETLSRVDAATLSAALRGAESPVTQHLLGALPLHRRLRIQHALHAQQPLTVRAILTAQDTLLQAAMHRAAVPSVSAGRELIHA